MCIVWKLLVGYPRSFLLPSLIKKTSSHRAHPIRSSPYRRLASALGEVEEECARLRGACEDREAAAALSASQNEAAMTALGATRAELLALLQQQGQGQGVAAAVAPAGTLVRAAAAATPASSSAVAPSSSSSTTTAPGSPYGARNTSSSSSSLSGSGIPLSATRVAAAGRVPLPLSPPLLLQQQQQQQTAAQLQNRVATLTDALEAALVRESSASADAGRLRDVLDTVQSRLDARAAEVSVTSL